jgi:hypothetical protein
MCSRDVVGEIGALRSLDQRRAFGYSVGTEAHVAKLLARVDEGAAEGLAVHVDREPCDPRGRIRKLVLETLAKEERDQSCDRDRN